MDCEIAYRYELDNAEYEDCVNAVFEEAWSEESDSNCAIMDDDDNISSEDASTADEETRAASTDKDWTDWYNSETAVELDICCATLDNEEVRVDHDCCCATDDSERASLCCW